VNIKLELVSYAGIFLGVVGIAFGLLCWIGLISNTTAWDCATFGSLGLVGIFVSVQVIRAGRPSKHTRE